MSAEAMATAAGFVQQLAKDLNNDDLELPMIPDSVVRIQQVFSADEVDIDEIVKIISSDTALTARMLQLANSAAVRGNLEITEVRQAVIRIGNKLVQSSAVAFALRQAEQNEQISEDCRAALKDIWTESVELAARSFVIARQFTKLKADEALLMGLMSVVGKLYIFMKAQEHDGLSYMELESVLADWHPAISQAIADSWKLSEEIVNALATQLETNPEVKENATLAEVLSASRLLWHADVSGTPLNAAEYPLLQRLGIANHTDEAVSLEEHAEELESVRQGLRG